MYVCMYVKYQHICVHVDVCTCRCVKKIWKQVYNKMCRYKCNVDVDKCK